MLKDRILLTIRFFDLQDIPLTLLEIHRFLIGDIQQINLSQDERWELYSDISEKSLAEFVSLAEVLICLNSECQGSLVSVYGYYSLPGREAISVERWKNYTFAIFRERRLKRFVPLLRHLPFLRGVALGGSQSVGQPKVGSDIDLFVIVEPGFLWLTRTCVSFYFQILGLRRHGKRVANRFCLNHYVAGAKAVGREKNLYKAMEYVRLRPLVYSQGISEFLNSNLGWIKIFMPNWETEQRVEEQSWVQKFLEKLLNNFLGRSLDKFLGFFQKIKIRQDEFTFVLPDELSFHPHSQHRELLAKFFNPEHTHRHL